MQWVPLIESSDAVVEEGQEDFDAWEDVERHASALHSRRMEEFGAVLWRVHLFKYKGNSVLFFRWHHIVGDGASLGAVWFGMADNVSYESEVPHVSWSQWARLWLWIALTWWLVVLRWLWMFAAYPVQPGPFKREAADASDAKKQPLHFVKKQRLALSHERVVPLSVFKEQGRRAGTVNDYMLAAVNRAIASLTGEYDKSLAMAMAVNIRLHRDEKPVLRNLIGSMSLFLPPVNPEVESFEKSAKKVSAVTQTVKSLPEAYVGALTLMLTNLVPVSWAQWLFFTMSSRARLVLSNVVGAKQRLQLFGGEALMMMGFVPPPSKTPCAIGVLSYAGGIFVSVACSPSFTIEPRVLVDAIERELRTNLLSN